MRWSTINNYTHVNYEIWDTAGQERYRSMVPMYMRGANVVLLVYDATDISTYEHAIKYWLEYIRDHFAEKMPPVILVENKIDYDFAGTKIINTEVEHKCRTSAKTGEGIDTLRELIKAVTADQVAADQLDAEYKLIKRISLPPGKKSNIINCC